MPRILSLGVEIKTKTDPDYCRAAIRKSLVNHLLNPDAISKVASTYSAKDSEMIKGLAEELDAGIVSFDSGMRAKAKIPMEMTFSPEKNGGWAFVAYRGTDSTIAGWIRQLRSRSLLAVRDLLPSEDPLQRRELCSR